MGTGRPADIADLIEQVGDFHEVARVVEAMVADLRAQPGAWENASLDRYLEALAALIDSVDALLTNRGRSISDKPDWRLLAELLVGASGYE